MESSETPQRAAARKAADELQAMVRIDTLFGDLYLARARELLAPHLGESDHRALGQAQTEAGLKALEAKMVKALIAKTTAASKITVVAWDAATDLYSIAPGAAKNPDGLTPIQIDTAANPIASATLYEVHGQIGFNITLTTAIDVQLVDGGTGAKSGAVKSMKTFGVQLGQFKDIQATPVALYALSGNLVRAGWNYFLVEGDSSLGLHNPTFVQEVLAATLAKDLSN